MLIVISGQWAPPTILGFAVFGSGLALAAARGPAEEEEDEEDEATESADEIEGQPRAPAAT
jgi:hypothetical protein